MDSTDRPDPHHRRHHHRRRALAAGLVAGALLVPAAASTWPATSPTASPAGPDEPRPSSSGRPSPVLAQDVTDDGPEQLTREARRRLASPGYREARAAANDALAAGSRPLVRHEREAPGVTGANDTPRTAEPVVRFGTGEGRRNVLHVQGRTADLGGGSTSRLPAAPEDNGSIPQAVETGLSGPGTVTTSGVLGDGPHGPDGDGSNDVDFYAVDLPAGHQVVADTSGSAPAAATGLVVYDAEGDQVASATRPGRTPGSSRLVVTPRAAGRYFVMVAGAADAGPFPADPFDSGSGAGGAATGDYALSLSVRRADVDHYAVRLRPGDVLGAVGSGSVGTVRVLGPDGAERVGTTGADFSSLYPTDSPLPGGGNATLALVAEERGWYRVAVDGDPGRYRLQLEAYRPSGESTTTPQTVLLDVGGGRVNTRVWGGPGVRELSPFASFLRSWGIPRSREDAVVRKVTREVRAALVREVAEAGPHADLGVRVVSSRTHPRLRGADDVTRVVVAGTVEESGVATLGVADTVDPGNFGREDSALVLLDLLSAPAGEAWSLNTYLRPASDREGFVAQAVGNVAAHEVGHTLGSYHTDNREIDELMDSGGSDGFSEIYGVGPDGVGGTRDDVNLTLGTDGYARTEGFTGTQDTASTTAWAYPWRR